MCLAGLLLQADGVQRSVMALSKRARVLAHPGGVGKGAHPPRGTSSSASTIRESVRERTKQTQATAALAPRPSHHSCQTPKLRAPMVRYATAVADAAAPAV